MSKWVEIDFKLCEWWIEVSIIDEGLGFDLGDVLDLMVEENLDKMSGWGLLLICSFMNVVEYNE